MEDSKIQLLLLEDNVDDAVYIQRTLLRSGIKLETRVVSTRHDFITTLDRFSPDLILSDHQLPRFNSSEALQIGRKKYPFVPFILVTGAVSEEFAVSIIQAGADDYLLKSNLKRLPTAVTQAIEKKRIEESLFKAEEARREAEKQLQEEHKRLLFHIENTSLGYIEWDSQLRVQAWSKKAEEIFGWTAKEFMETQKNGYGLVVEEDFTKTNKISEELILGKVDGNKLQTRNRTKDRGIIWCEWFNTVMRDDQGKVTTILSMVQDITARKTFEDILKEYNDRYDMLSKATNDAIWDWDIVLDIEIWNHGIETIFGYTERATSSSKTWWQEKIHPADFERVTGEMQLAFNANAHNWTSEYRYLCADGSFKYVLDRGYILYENERPIRMIGAMQDITKQKNFMREIEDLSLVASKTINSVVITDANDKIEWVNEAFVRLTGYHLSEVRGLNPGDVLQGPDTDQNAVMRMAEKVKNQEAFTEEILNYSKHGDKYWLRLDISPVFDEQKHLNHFISIQTDITAQKQFENQITNIARELSSLIENANVPIFGVDRNGYISEWNKVAAELSGFTKNEVLEKKWISFLDPAIHEDIQGMLNHAFVGEPTPNYELPFRSKSGKQLVLLISLSPRMDVNKNIYGAICVGQDISEVFRYRQGLETIVKERTRDLNEALQKEKELVDLKSKFVSIASHEFRTPLSTISLAAGMLKRHREKFSTDEFNAKLETIEKQVLHMTYLLDDILMIGKADAGKIQTNYTRIPIEEFFTQTSHEVEGAGNPHKIKIHIRCTVREFQADEKLLRNVLINLLTNAIKFSNYIKDVYLTITNSDNYLKLEIEDKGIGIAEEDLETIFSAFHRGGNVGAIPGTGLGLSIVKKAVDLLKGEIKVTSRLGKGTIFTVMLPLGI